MELGFQEDAEEGSSKTFRRLEKLAKIRARELSAFSKFEIDAMHEVFKEDS